MRKYVAPNKHTEDLLNAAVKCGLHQACVSYRALQHDVQFVGPFNGSLFNSDEAKNRQMIVYNHDAGWVFLPCKYESEV